jgi:hypothetical protein
VRKGDSSAGKSRSPQRGRGGGSWETRWFHADDDVLALVLALVESSRVESFTKE